METSAHILASLVCTKCEQLLKRGPVYQQQDGAAVCGLCQASDQSQPAFRCLLYEATAELVRFPCRYREEGCPATVPFVAADSTGFNHEDACEYRQYVCPVLGSNRCDWAGRRNQLKQHCREEHPDCVLPNPTLITPNIRQSQIKDYIISAFNFLFLLHTRVCVSTAKLHYAVRLLDDPQLASNYSYTVTIQRGEDILTRSRDVLPQELLALQEHSALNLCINSLLRVLGGWDGASIAVEVKARGAQAEPKQEQAQHRLAEQEREQEREQCGECGACTPRLFRNNQGWLCAGCAPQKVTCVNRDCDFQDIGEGKRNKHSWHLCQHGTWCYMCDTVLQPGTQLLQHYRTCEKIKVIPDGSKLLVRYNNGVQWFLVEAAVGHLLCEVFYTKDNFSLRVYAPMPCEKFHLYRCEVRLKCANHSRLHTPDTLYYNDWDWEVKCKKDNFFGNPKVYVTIQVKKIE